MSIKTELHCHNSFSNFHLGYKEPPYDCDISIRDQLEQSYELGLDAIFVTNHNTLDGYDQLLKYKNEHNIPILVKPSVRRNIMGQTTH